MHGRRPGSVLQDPSDESSLSAFPGATRWKWRVVLGELRQGQEPGCSSVPWRGGGWGVREGAVHPSGSIRYKNGLILRVLFSSDEQ